MTLVVADPDVPTGLFVQWTATGMAPRAASVGQGKPLPHEGLNGSGKRGWAAPCPPRGPSHRYLFILTAVNASGKPIAEVDMITHYKRR